MSTTASALPALLPAKSAPDSANPLQPASRANAVPRVLLVAYQCGPGMGSVSQIGWEWFARMAQAGPVTLVTHNRNEHAIRKTLAQAAEQRANGQTKGRHDDLHAAAQAEIIYIDTEWFARPVYQLSCKLFPKSEHAVFLTSSVDYFVFDHAVIRQLKHRARDWDVVHRVTPVTPWAPTRLATLGLPVIIGPLNGGLGAAKNFADIARSDGEQLRLLRGACRLLDHALGSTRRAAYVLSATQATRDSIPAAYHHKVIDLIENGIEPQRFVATPWPAPPQRGNASRPLRLLFVGRMVPVKGIGMLLQAIAQIKDAQVNNDWPLHVDLIGDGPMRAAWQQQADTLGLQGVVHFLGAKPLDDVAHAMQRCHVFCLPSIRESGGAVLLEAMASGRPSITVKFGGPAEIVDDSVGVAIPPDGPQAVIDGLIAAIRDVFDRPEVWRQRGEHGISRAEDLYSWDAKVRAAHSLYAKVLAAPPRMQEATAGMG